MFTKVILLALLTLMTFAAALEARAALNVAHHLTHPARLTSEDLPSEAGIERWEDITLNVEGVPIEGWFVPPAPERHGATLIMIHGWGAYRQALLGQMGVLVRNGYGVLTIDLRNSGESGGDITTWGYLETEDVQAAFDYLLTRPDVNPGRIGLLGHSMGGATAIRAATQIPEVRIVIAESSYTTLQEMTYLVRGRFPVPPTIAMWALAFETGYPMHELRPIDDVAHLAPRPIMFIHGTEDIVVHPSHSERLFQQASEPKKLYLVEGAGHDNIYQTDREAFEREMISFLDRYLGGEESTTN